MSFGFGIGDVIAAINALVEACDKIAKVPKEILEASGDSKRLLAIIESVGKATEEKTSIAHREPSIKKQLHLDIKEVTVDVGKLRNHLRIWKRQDKQPPLHSATQRILFAFYNIPEIKEIRVNFDEYRTRLNLMLNVLNIKSHNEARRGHVEMRRGQDEMLKLMKQIQVNFAEFERRKESRLSLEESRENEREKKYLEWESLGFGEKTLPGKVAELQNFLEQKQQKLEESLLQEARHEHLNEITSKLWDAQTWEPTPQIRVSRHQETDSRAYGVSSSTRRQRRSHHSSNSREDSRTSSGSKRIPRASLSTDSTSHMSQSQSSASSRSSHHRRRDPSQASTSTATSFRERLLAGINRGFQASPTTSSRRASVSNSSVQSSVGTPRPWQNNDISQVLLGLSLTEDENEEGCATVSTHNRAQYTSPSTSASNNQLSSRRCQLPTTQINNPAPRSRQEVNILCVNWDNIAFSKLAQIYFELLRLWSINTNSLWLFDRVESAGIRINTVTDIDSHFAMHLLSSSDFESRDFPNEKERLLSRIVTMRPTVFDKEYLKDFKYVLCFDQKSYEAVNEASSGQLTPPSGQLIRGVSLELDHLAGKKLRTSDAETATNNVKFVVESFLKKRLDWERPDRRLAQGQRRTLHMTVNKEMTGHIIGKGGAKIKALRDETRCSIRIFDEGIKSDRSLILAIGQAIDLAEVERRINALPTPRTYRR